MGRRRGRLRLAARRTVQDRRPREQCSTWARRPWRPCWPSGPRRQSSTRAPASSGCRPASPVRPCVLASVVAPYWPGPPTVNSSRWASFLPSPVHMAPWAWQSVVSGRVIVTSPLPLGLLDRSAGDREGVVPQGLVAQAELLAEAQLEGEGPLPVVGRGDVLQAGGQRRRRQTRHRIRGRAGQLLLVAPVVGEAHPHLDGLAHVVGGQGVG